jgi:hypothetical protein
MRPKTDAAMKNLTELSELAA